ncbi:MAG TPA: IS110 family transposase [Streptosporangiaceae bacterium]|nr:IS110 family transposase [Streptosporangiaceae bacterium]HME64660.1 IS110 family transposase [Streptosporangiaceae bacterium]
MTDEPLYRNRVCGIDIGKAQMVATIRVPSDRDPARRAAETRTFATTKRGVLALADWCRSWQVPAVVMEATGDYWKGPFYRLEAEGLECVLADARQVKNLPGRPKRDPADSRWLAACFERGAVTSCFVATPEFRIIRLHTRYRRDLIEERTRDKQRAEKLLESAAIKISSVVSDLHGVTGRDIMDHLIAGERNPKVLAQLARAAARRKIAKLEEALEGAEFFTAEHAGLLMAMLERIDRVTADIARLSEVIEQLLAPYEEQLQQAESMPGWRRRSAEDAIAETGADMTRFPTGAHLASWGSRAPLDHQSGTRKGRARSKKGNRYLAGVLGETAVAAGRTQTREGARYRRLTRRIGKPKAQVAVGNTQLKVLHKLLSNPGMRHEDLGPDYYERRASLRRQIHHHVTHLESLGFEVTLCRTPDPQPGPAGQAHAV